MRFFPQMLKLLQSEMVLMKATLGVVLMPKLLSMLFVIAQHPAKF
ncbi:hypothetical protein Goshw_016968 [Gossypium schwendimanii]|nr:hypothetical protein [Gossypium schwendimanii]